MTTTERFDASTDVSTDVGTPESNNDNHPPTAVVIGAGPAGLSVSLGLSKRGWKVILIEKYKTFEVRGASFGLQSNGRKALEEICPGIVQTNMIDTGCTVRQPQDPDALLIPWWMLRDALLERVRERPSTIDLKMGLSVIEIVDDETVGDKLPKRPVQLKFESGETIEGDLVIGADGVHSKVRELLRLPPLKLTGSKVFRGTVKVSQQEQPDDDGSNSSLLAPLLDKGFCPLSATYKGIFFFVLNFHPNIPGRLCWVFSTQDPGVDESYDLAEELRKHETDADKLALMLAIFEASAKESLSSYTATKIADFSDQALDAFGGRWGGKGRVTLMGDAAHAMRPTDGLGGNMAFEDAVVLGRLLDNDDVRNSCGGNNHDEKNNKIGSTIASVLAQFESSRLPRVKAIHDQQRLRYEARMKGQAPAPVDPEFKEWLRKGV